MSLLDLCLFCGIYVLGVDTANIRKNRQTQPVLRHIFTQTLRTDCAGKVSGYVYCFLRHKTFYCRRSPS